MNSVLRAAHDRLLAVGQFLGLRTTTMAALRFEATEALARDRRWRGLPDVTMLCEAVYAFERYRYDDAMVLAAEGALIRFEGHGVHLFGGATDARVRLGEVACGELTRGRPPP